MSVKRKEGMPDTRLTLGKAWARTRKNQAHGVWQVFNIDCDTREMGDASTNALDRD
jgi:hypothetical protein